MASILALSGAAMATADTPSATADEAKTIFVDEGCNYFLSLWGRNDVSPRNWVEGVPGRPVKLWVDTAKVVEDMKCTNGEIGGMATVFDSVELDADANGTFETVLSGKANYATATAPFKPRSLPYRVQARTTAPNGSKIAAEYFVFVDSFAGVSINAGAAWTNTRLVNLNVYTPPGADSVKISNSSSMKSSSEVMTLRPGRTTKTWRMPVPRSGPSTVYVRFYGSGRSWNFKDAIKLDSVRPTLSSLKAKNRNGKTEVKIKASDSKSGLSALQVSRGRANAGVKVTSYRKVMRLTKSTKSVHVRVRDKAGNWSGWRSAKP
ncbi:MAG: hypothetical protein EON52_14995 [Actinomycetales bacterium]|nr:MAG: hypothetical protein EON52_14995 [Actinomycetales bacterium]